MLLLDTHPDLWSPDQVRYFIQAIKLRYNLHIPTGHLERLPGYRLARLTRSQLIQLCAGRTEAGVVFAAIQQAAGECFCNIISFRLTKRDWARAGSAGAVSLCPLAFRLD